MAEYMNSTDATFKLTGAMTIGCWVKPASININCGLLSKYGASGQRSYALTLVSSSNRPMFLITTSGGPPYATVTGDDGLSIGQWNFVVATFEPSTSLKMYQDGLLTAENTVGIPATIFDSTTNFELGRFGSDDNSSYDGVIDGAFIFDRVLSAVEINQLYNFGEGRNYAGLSDSLLSPSGFDKSNLVAWYDLENEDDSHTSELDLTEVNSPTYTSGLINNALELDASSNQHLSSSNAAFDITGAMTVGCWVKTDSASANQGIISKSAANGNRSFDLYRQSNNEFRFAVNSDGSTYFTADSTTPCEIGKWIFVVGVYVPSTSIKIYVNGIEEGENTTSIPASIYDSTANFEIGRRIANDAQDWDGQIDGAFVFSRALSEEEIRRLYNYHTGVAYSGL